MDTQSEKLIRVGKYKEQPKRDKEYNSEMKNTLEGINGRLNDTEEQVSELEDRIVETNDAEQKKRMKRKRTV